MLSTFLLSIVRASIRTVTPIGYMNYLMYNISDGGSLGLKSVALLSFCWFDGWVGGNGGGSSFLERLPSYLCIDG